MAHAWHLGTWIWGGLPPSLTPKSSLLSQAVLGNNIACPESLFFLMGVLNFGLCKAKRVYVSSPRYKPWVLNLQWASLANIISRVCSQFAAGEIKCIPCDPIGRRLWKLMPGFLWTLPLELFIFADSTLCPFVIINRSHEHGCILTPASPSSKLPRLGWSWKPMTGKWMWLSLGKYSRIYSKALIPFLFFSLKCIWPVIGDKRLCNCIHKYTYSKI